MLKVKNNYVANNLLIDHKSYCGIKHEVDAEIIVVEFNGEEFQLAFFKCPEFNCNCVEEIE